MSKWTNHGHVSHQMTSKWTTGWVEHGPVYLKFFFCSMIKFQRHQKYTRNDQETILTCSTSSLFTKKMMNRMLSRGRHLIYHMGVSKNSVTTKSSMLIGVFHYKPSILGYPSYWKYPYIYSILQSCLCLDPKKSDFSPPKSLRCTVGNFVCCCQRQLKPWVMREVGVNGNFMGTINELVGGFKDLHPGGDRYTGTPWKINMPIEKDNHLPSLHFWVPCQFSGE